MPPPTRLPLEEAIMARPIVYQGDLGTLLETSKEGYAGRDESCVALPQAVTDVGHTSRWQPGAKVVGLDFLLPGTVIANFKFEDNKARFPNAHGYHVALFQEFGNRVPGGGYTHIWVIDQWPGHTVKRRNKNAVSAEEMKRRRWMPCDNANDYYVVLVP
jgi:hypothetical protein